MGQQKMAPLVIFFVPKHMELHWQQTMRDCETEAKRLHSVGVYMEGDIRIWKGNPADGTQSVKTCFDDNIKTFWILPLITASLDVLTEHPDYAVSGVVYDELTTGMSKKGNKSWSTIAGPVVVVQATVQCLADNFVQESKTNILQKAVGQHAMMSTEMMRRLLMSCKLAEISRGLMCSANLHMSLPSCKFMRMVAGASVEHMPPGVTQHRLIPNKKTIYDIICVGNLRERNIAMSLRDFFLRQREPSCFAEEVKSCVHVEESEVCNVIDFEKITSCTLVFNLQNFFAA
jgi:hypothetical protein